MHAAALFAPSPRLEDFITGREKHAFTTSNHGYILGALSKGGACSPYSARGDLSDKGCLWLRVTCVRKTLGPVARNFNKGVRTSEDLVRAMTAETS